MFINVKMPTSVGISIFISMINITSESLKERYVSISQTVIGYEQFKCDAQLK